MSPTDTVKPDPSHRMLLAIRYTERGDIGGVEAIAVPTWRDLAEEPEPADPVLTTRPLPSQPRVQSAIATGPVDSERDVTLLYVPGGRLVLKFDGAANDR